MKFPISWHEECLKNAEYYLRQVRARALKCVADYRRQREEIRQQRAQLEEAKRRGLDGYDRERFMKKRGAK